MKGGIFTKWFRELATLIFTQTIQAFLLAIVMSIVISAMAASGDSSQTNYAAGMLAIIALSQFGKIERLVKEIFGVTSGLGLGAGMDAGKGALTAGKLIAMKGAKATFDNAKKIGSGAKNAIKSQGKIMNLKREKENLALEGANEEAASDAALAEKTASDTAIPGGIKPKVGVGAGEGNGTGMDAGASASAGAALGNGAGTGLNDSALRDLIVALQNNTTALGKSNGDVNEDGSAKTKEQKINEQIEAEKKNRNAGLKNVASGVAESVGAIGGGAFGAAAGLATGNVAEGVGIGVGIGDTIGKAAVSGVAGAASVPGGVKKVVKGVHKHNTEKNELKDKKKEIVAQLDDNIKKVKTQTEVLQKNYGSSDSEATARSREFANATRNKAKQKYQDVKFGKKEKHTTYAGTAAGAIASTASTVANKIGVGKGLTRQGKTDKAFKDIGNV